MKIRFGLITFYQCFECCQRGFAKLHSVQGSGERNDLWFQMSPPHIKIRFIVSLKPCLNLCSLRWRKPGRNLVNSFIPYGLSISKILLGKGLINSKSLFLKILIFSEFLTSRLSLFHSTIEEQKKEFLKLLCLI